MPSITPFLWFDTQAEEAMNLYTSIFKNSKVLSVSRAQGRVMSVEFELQGQKFMGLNAGPQYQFSEAVSFFVACDSQAEIDEYWEKLRAGGDENAQQCGWLKDKFGVSWQVVPTVLAELIKDPDSDKSGRVMKALLQMKKLDIAALKRAYAG